MQTQIPVGVSSPQNEAEFVSHSRAQSQTIGMLLVASIVCAMVVAMAAISRADSIAYRVSVFGGGRLITSWLLMILGQSVVVGMMLARLRPIGRILSQTPLGRRSLAIIIPVAALASTFMSLLLLATVSPEPESIAAANGDYWYVRIALAASLPLCLGAFVAIASLFTKCREMFFLQLCIISFGLAVIQTLAYICLLAPAWLPAVTEWS